MIELPEVIQITKQMNEELLGKKIENVTLANYEGLVKVGFMKGSPSKYKKRLIGKSIDSITSKGKYFFVKLLPEHLLVFSFENRGSVLYHENKDSVPKKYTIKLDFSDGTISTIRIISWGFLLVENKKYFEDDIYIGNLGISPLDDQFTFENFNQLLEKHKKSIKTFFVCQKYVAGIGNGYLQDILFKAKVHPKRKTLDLTEEERNYLYLTIKKILNEAIRLSGRDSEVDLYGKPGSYKSLMGKHMKDKSCINCGKKIRKLSIDGSSAYICPFCQKL